MGQDTSGTITSEVISEKEGFNPAQTQRGRQVDALTGLKRYLLDTSNGIKLDKKHFLLELGSDAVALWETGKNILHLFNYASSESFAQAVHNLGTDNIEEFQDIVSTSLDVLGSIADDPHLAEMADAGSAFVALILLHSLYKQRKEKEHNFDRALRFFLEYEDDLHNPELGDSKEKRERIASKNLSEKMIHSGLMFSALSDDRRTEHDFHASDFRIIAKRRGIKSRKSYLQRKFDAVREFSTELASNTTQTLKKGGADLIDANYNFFHDVVAELITAVATNWTNKEIYLQVLRTSKQMREQSRDRKKIRTMKGLNEVPRNQLSVKHLRTASMQCVESNETLAEEFKEDLLLTMRDAEKAFKNRKRAKRDTILQGAFLVLQAGKFFAALAEQNGEDMAKAFYSFSACQGPLYGFAKEWSEQHAKLRSLNNIIATKLAHAMDLNIDELPTWPGHLAKENSAPAPPAH